MPTSVRVCLALECLFLVSATTIYHNNPEFVSISADHVGNVGVSEEDCRLGFLGWVHFRAGYEYVHRRVCQGDPFLLTHAAIAQGKDTAA